MQFENLVLWQGFHPKAALVPVERYADHQILHQNDSH